MQVGLGDGQARTGVLPSKNYCSTTELSQLQIDLACLPAHALPVRALHMLCPSARFADEQSMRSVEMNLRRPTARLERPSKRPDSNDRPDEQKVVALPLSFFSAELKMQKK